MIITWKHFLIFILLFSISCSDSEHEFYYSKDPTEIFYVQEQSMNFSVEENVLGQFSVSGSADSSENFTATKKPNRSLGYYTQSEEVIQVENISKVDIVWSIDNSASMSILQEKLAQNLSIFIEDFVEKDIDFKMAIVTTENSVNRDSNNKLNSAELKKNKTNFINDFKNKIKVGIDPIWQYHPNGREERSFKFVKQFLQENPSWIRSDAKLVAIYLSDEPEQSSGTVKSYVDYMRSLKGNELERVKTFSICDGRVRNWTKIHAVPGGSFNGCERFQDMSDKTGGLVRYINGTFSDISREFAESISSSLTRLKTVFALNITPAESSKLKIEIDGSIVPRDTTESDGWDYDGGDNSIEFFGSHIPADGSGIKVYEEGEVMHVFQLTQDIDSDRVDFLIVEVGGHRIPRDTSESNGWNYDGATKRVEIFGRYRPSAGARVKITLPGEVDNFVHLTRKLNPNHLDKVEVSIGGNTVPKDSTKTDGWEYNQQKNTIEFFGSHTLTEGDAVRISLGATSSFCSLRGFDLNEFVEFKVVIEGKRLARDTTGTNGWDYNRESGCIELYGEQNLTPGLLVEVSWGEKSQFCLNRPLDEKKLDTAVIKVDGVVVEKGQEGVGWDYDEKTNCMSFFGYQLPGANSKIEITYTPDYKSKKEETNDQSN